MAGNYPDVPAPRMAYDRDGTTIVHISESSSTILATLSGAQITNMNRESIASNAFSFITAQGQGTRGIVLLFPQLRDLSGYHVNSPDSTVPGLNAAIWNALRWSADTTNGIDGTWTTVETIQQSTNNLAAMRTAIRSLSLSGVKALKFLGVSGSGNNSRGFASLHLYGAVSAGETPDRLRPWHPTLDEPLDDNNSGDGAFFDWGDIQRNTTSDNMFRIKNNSATLTANNITVLQEALTDTTPSVGAQFTFSDGGAFAPSIDIGSLAPGAISSIITKRYSRPSNAALSLWTSRTVVNPGSWT